MVANSGMAQGLEDTAMSVWRFASGALAFTHQGFSTPHAEVSLELHGTEGTLQGVGILHQVPEGRLLLRRAAGEQALPLAPDNLYVHGLRQFHRAIQGQPHDAADGEAGVKSLAVALAVLQSAASGRSVALAA